MASAPAAVAARASSIRVIPQILTRTAVNVLIPSANERAMVTKACSSFSRSLAARRTGNAARGNAQATRTPPDTPPEPDTGQRGEQSPLLHACLAPPALRVPIPAHARRPQ